MARRRYKAYTFTPSQGGRLMASVSKDTVGVKNYLTKRDFRRVLDREQRREGYDYFAPNRGVLFEKQYSQAPKVVEGGESRTDAINLIHMAIRPNGDKAVIVGTTTGYLYRYEGTDTLRYFTDTRDSDHDAIYTEEQQAINESGWSKSSTSGAWGASQSHSAFAQTSTTGSGTGALFSVETDSGGIPTFTWVSGGTGYAVSDTLTFTDPYLSGKVCVLYVSGVDDSWGSELAVGVVGNYAPNGVKNLTVETGEEYYYAKGAADTNLVNGNETLTASGYFKAQSTSVTLNGAASVDVTASVKKHDATRDYAQSVPAEWRVIREPDSNSVNLKRWEAVNINGYTIFNNGADLPLVYRVEWEKAKPIYALREAGVARVGTIAEQNGILLCGDISQMRAQDIQPQMESASPYSYYDKAVDRIGYRVLFSDLDAPTSFGATSYGTIFEGARVMAWRWNPSSIGREEVTITGAGVGGGNLTSNIVGSYTKTASSFKVSGATFKGKYEEGDFSKDIKHKDSDGNEYEGISVEDGLPRAFEIGEVIHFENGAAFCFTSNANSSAKTIYGTLLGDVPNDEQGDAATDYVKLDEFASTSTASSGVATSYAYSGTAGFDDLQDDGSAVLKMVKLQNVLVVYKETSIFIAEYTGSTDSPFRFNFVKVPASQSLRYKHTVASVGGMAHIYAGASSFYSFDLASRKPKELPNFKNADSLFFSSALAADTESIYAADNQLTKEVWFISNGSSDDKALCYDYIFNTLSTTSIGATAAGTVSKPGSKEDWFVMGTNDGVVLTYGLVQESYSRWSGVNFFNRRGDTNYSTSETAYDAVLESGAEDFGDSFGEKDIRSFVLHLAHASESPSTTVVVSGYHNVGDVVSGSADNVLETRVYDDPDTKNLLPLYYKQHYFQDKITISTGNAQVAGRTFEVAGVDSRSFVRTDDA